MKFSIPEELCSAAFNLISFAVWRKMSLLCICSLIKRTRRQKTRAKRKKIGKYRYGRNIVRNIERLNKCLLEKIWWWVLLIDGKEEQLESWDLCYTDPNRSRLWGLWACQYFWRQYNSAARLETIGTSRVLVLIFYMTLACLYQTKTTIFRLVQTRLSSNFWPVTFTSLKIVIFFWNGQIRPRQTGIPGALFASMVLCFQHYFIAFKDVNRPIGPEDVAWLDLCCAIQWKKPKIMGYRIVCKFHWSLID